MAARTGEKREHRWTRSVRDDSTPGLFTKSANASLISERAVRMVQCLPGRSTARPLLKRVLDPRVCLGVVGEHPQPGLTCS